MNETLAHYQQLRAWSAEAHPQSESNMSTVEPETAVEHVGNR